MAAVVTLAGLIAGVTLAFASARTASVRLAFPRFGVSVRYPEGWGAVKGCWSGVQETPFGLLTTAQPLPACSKPAVGVAQTFLPPEQLGANGVALGLSQLGLFPGAKVSWNGRVAGRPAHVAAPEYGDGYDTAVACPAGAGREYRTVGIRWPHASNTVLKAEAVICGPDLAAGVASFQRVLDSIRFRSAS